MLVNGQDKKMMNLMTHLYRYNNEWLNIRNLMHYLGVSRKTLYSYLNSLELIFQDLVDFNYCGSMIKSSFDSKFGLLTMQRTFLSKSLIVNILKLTFFQKDINKLDLAIDLNVSETSIYNSVKFLNDSLEGVYKLDYSYSSLQFVGQEEEIRKFFINFFIETNPYPNERIFNDLLDEESVKIIVRNLAPYIHGKMYYAHFEYIKIGLAVSIIRLRQGYKLETDEKNAKLVKIVKDLSKNKDISNFIEKEFPHSEDKVEDILYQILTYFFYNDFLFFIEKPEVILDNSYDSNKLYEFYDKSITYLINKYKLTIRDKKELYRLIFTYFKFKISNIDGVDFFVDHSEYFVNYVKFFNVDFHKDLNRILKEYLDMLHPKFKYKLRDLVYTTYTLRPDLIPQLIKTSMKPKALIISHDDHYYTKSLENIVNLWFENVMDVDTLDECEIDFKKIKNSDYDLVIADFIIKDDIGDKIIFTFEQMPLINEIAELVLKVSQKNIEKVLKKYPEEFEGFRRILGY